MKQTALIKGASSGIVKKFEKTSGLDFQDSFRATEVAKAGYSKMMKGEQEVLVALTFGQRMMMRMVPFTKKKCF